MVTKAYLCAGKDGFDVLKKVKVLVSERLLQQYIFDCSLKQSYGCARSIQVDEEDSIMLNCAVQNHFQAIEKLRANKTKQRPSHHRQSLVTISRRYFFFFIFFPEIRATRFALLCFIISCLIFYLVIIVYLCRVSLRSYASLLTASLTN